MCVRGCGCTGAGLCLSACSFVYPVCHAHAPYCLRPLAPLHFRHCHKRHDFRKKLLNVKCVFRFSLQLLFETFLILRRNQRNIVINVKTS